MGWERERRRIERWPTISGVFGHVAERRTGGSDSGLGGDQRGLTATNVHIPG